MLHRFIFLICLLLLTSVAVASNTVSVSGQVIDSQSGQPVSGAVIVVDGARQTISDANGFFRFDYAVNDAYRLIKIRIRAQGYGVWTMPKAILYSGEARVLPTVRLGANRVRLEDKQLPGIFLRTQADIDAAKTLVGEMQADTYLPRNADPRSHVSHFVIPMTIKVGLTDYIHCSDWIQAGQPVNDVIEMDFKEYIKNVLPNEWVHTWHTESLKAGAMAAKTFAWWRMTLTTTRPGGADVVDNTCDQVFIQNSRRPSTDAAVDATWHLRLSRDNRIRVVHYLAYDWQCADAVWYPQEPCMGQWDSKYMADNGAKFDEILHHYYDPIDMDTTTTIIPNVNVVTNSSFGVDATGWAVAGGIDGGGVASGVYQFHRTADSAIAAVMYQDINTAIPANSPLRLKIMLGNSSDVAKVVGVHLHHVDNWDGAISCQFEIPPKTPLQKYTMWGGNPTGWPALRLEIIGESADSLPAYRIDKVKVMYRAGANLDAVTPCEAPLPGVPKINTPIAAAKYSKMLNVNVTPGASNLRPGYAPAFHVQVSGSATFETSVFDNQETLSFEPNIPVILPTGAYYLRVRQFDGIDRYSKWSPAVAFTVVEKPNLLSPVNAEVVNMTDFNFSWDETSGATSYKIRVKDGNGVNVLVKVLSTADANCVAGVCTVPVAILTTSPAAIFVDGLVYQWDVQARTPVGKAKSRSTFRASIQ